MTPQEEMRYIFFDSAAELLQKLNEDALQLETNPQDVETLRDIRRAVHTIKGDSAVLGFRELSELAHELEDVLTPESALSLAGGLADVVLSAADMFDAMLAAYRGGVRPPSGDPLRAMIWKFGQQPPAATVAATAMQPKFAWSEAENFAVEEAVSRRLAVYNVAIRIAVDSPMRSAGAELLRTALQSCGEVLACTPAADRWPEAESIEAALGTQLDEEALSAKLFVPGVAANLVVQRWSESLGHTFIEESGEDAAPQMRTREENVLRVDPAKVDSLLNLVGEMVVAKSMLQQAVADFTRCHPKDPLRAQLADTLAFQSQALRSLQRAAMGIRMVPAEQLFRRFPRLVRDLARQCGKQVALQTSGRDTELDKALVDALAEPLGHIVRNAVDHGIETPAQRQAAGKPESGAIRLHAFHQGNQMVIEVHDDGRGLDRAAIARRALERGLVTAEEAAHLDADELSEFIFEPGFSTSNQVTAISGRGIGMDVVRAAVNNLKGSVSVESTADKGCTVRLKLPLTLAILRSMLFRVGTGTFAVPLDMVEEIRRVDAREFARAGNREVLQQRDELVTIVRLGRMQTAAANLHDKMFLIIVAVGQRKFGLAVDALVGEQELVVKPVDEKTIASTLVSGASVLGDGAVALVLNVEEAVRRFATAAPIATPAVPKPEWGARA
jgi:two-component system chemotaxis sensor kinase CheA